MRIGMKRSALLAAVAAIGSGVGVVGVTGCGGTTTTASHGDAGEVIGPGTDYGIPSHGEPEDAGSSIDAMAFPDAPAAAYGIAAPPPDEDAGTEAGTTDAASAPDVIGGGTDYGIPPGG
jgi:hypothetical protein